MNTFSTFRSIAVELLKSPRTPSSTPCRGLLQVTLPLPHTPHRAFHLSYARAAWVKNNQPSKPVKSKENLKKEERLRKEIGLRNSDIPYKKVRVVEHGGFTSFKPLTDVLIEVDRLNAALGSEQPGASEGGANKGHKVYQARLVANDPDPIVKIINTREEYKKAKNARESAKANATKGVRKEMQMTWSSSEADVETKLEKVKSDLEKGYRVDLAMMPKRGVAAPSPQERQTRAQELVEQLAGAGKEWREREYTRNSVVIYLQGIASPAAETREAGGAHERILLKAQRREKLAKKLEEKRQQERMFLIDPEMQP